MPHTMRVSGEWGAMKNTYFMWLLSVAMALSIGSCGEKKARDAGSTNSLSEFSASSTQPVISGRSLQQVFSEAKDGAVKRENATSTKDQPFRYQVLDSSIKRGDIDGDGDSDAIILVTTCEKVGCHPTTNGSEVEIVKNNSEKYEVIKRFSVGSSPTVDSIRGGRVMISAMEYGDDDPGCCASEKHTFVAKISSAGQVSVAEIKRKNALALAVGNLTEADQKSVPSGAYCEARRTTGEVIYTATDFGLVSVNGNLVKLQTGALGYSSDHLSSTQGVTVSFKRRAGVISSSEEDESGTEPMILTVEMGNASVAVPVLRTCGA